MFEICSLTDLDLSALSHVSAIGDFFLGFSNLVKLHLPSLSEITSIGSYFINGCGNLRELDVSGLSRIKSIGGSFITNKKNLEVLLLGDQLPGIVHDKWRDTMWEDRKQFSSKQRGTSVF